MYDGTRIKIRIWHAARDVYHCAFRMMRLLCASDSKRIDTEILRILDLYLLFPPLLCRMSMPKDMKSMLGNTGVQHPDDIFTRLPSAAAAFQDLQTYQAVAISHLAAIGILAEGQLKKGVAAIETNNIPAGLQRQIKLRNDSNKPLIQFLTKQIPSLPLTGSDSLYRRAGLPARQIVS